MTKTQTQKSENYRQKYMAVKNILKKKRNVVIYLAFVAFNAEGRTKAIYRPQERKKYITK
jgi:hypothetical protein